MSLKIFIIVSIFFSSCQSDLKREKNKVIDDFFNNLEVGDEDIGNLIDLEDNTFWIEFLSAGNKSGFEKKITLFPPDVKPILEYHLVINGDTIKEEKINSGKRTIGEAFCADGKPTIRYYTKLKYIDEYGLAFFRMHEYAHFLLGHMNCGKNVFPKPELEFAADKKAIELLEQFKDGARIVDHARGIMLGLNIHGTSTHPSSIERAKAFYEKDNQ